jgi:DME family drug/metabolite transporter
MVSLLAIGSAFFWGLSYAFTRIGLRYANPLSGVLITMTCCSVVSLIIALFAIPLNQFVTRAVLYFMVAGVIGSFVGRFLFYVGVDTVGASIATPLSEIKPLFSAIVAIVILGERVTLSIALGTVFIILGAATISSEESGGHIEKKWSKRDLIFPILAGASWGVTHIFRKVGLNITPEPIIGLAVQNVTALIFYPLLVLVQKNSQRVVLNDKKSWFFFTLSGLSAVSAQLSFFYALDWGEVIVVSPLSSLSTFFLLLFVGIFLKKLEKITWKIVLGSVLIVGGTLLLTLMSSG